MKNNWREKTVLSVPEAAQVLGISRCLAYELVKTGDIPAIRLGGRRIIVPTESLTKILKQTESEVKNND